MLLVGLLIVVGLTAGFSAAVALMLRRAEQHFPHQRRRWLAPAIGASMPMSLAFVAAAPEGVMALFQVFVLTCGLALLAGYPAVRFFDSAPAS